MHPTAAEVAVRLPLAMSLELAASTPTHVTRLTGSSTRCEYTPRPTTARLPPRSRQHGPWKPAGARDGQDCPRRDAPRPAPRAHPSRAPVCSRLGPFARSSPPPANRARWAPPSWTPTCPTFHFTFSIALRRRLGRTYTSRPRRCSRRSRPMRPRHRDKFAPQRRRPRFPCAHCRRSLPRRHPPTDA